MTQDGNAVPGRYITRRRALVGTSIGLASLAGCGSGPNNGNGNSGDGVWTHPEDGPASFKAVMINWWKTQGRTFGSQMESAGFAIENNIVPGNNYFPGQGGMMDGPEHGGGWDLLGWFQNNGGINHPINYFDDALDAYKIVQRGRGEGGAKGERKFGWAGHERMVTIPEEVGAMEISGNGKEIDLWETYKTIQSTDTDQETISSLTNDLAWWWNFDVPDLMIMERQEQTIGDFEHFDRPDIEKDGHPNNDAIGLDKGLLRAKDIDDQELTYDTDSETVPTDVDASPLGTNPWQLIISITTAPSDANRSSVSRGEYMPHLVKQNDLIDPKTWVVTYDDRFTWHNGKPVTTEDRYLSQRYEILLAAKKNQRKLGVVEVTKRDSQTLEHTLDEPNRGDVFLAGAGASPTYPRWVWRPWVEKLEDASTSEKAEQINTELKEDETIPLQERVGTSMWQIETVSDSTATYTKYPDHPYASEQNIERIKIHFVGGDSQKRLKIQNDQLDWVGGIPRGTQMPNTWQYIKWPGPGGMKYVINRNNPHLAKRDVRRAIHYYLDTVNMQKNRGRHFEVKAHDGMTQPARERWVDESIRDNYIDYGSAAKPEKGDEMMRKAGYEKQ